MTAAAQTLQTALIEAINTTKISHLCGEVSTLSSPPYFITLQCERKPIATKPIFTLSKPAASKTLWLFSLSQVFIALSKVECKVLKKDNVIHNEFCKL